MEGLGDWEESRRKLVGLRSGWNLGREKRKGM